MENNNKTIDLIRLIYLHLYKDTFLIFMQAYKDLQVLLNFSNYIRKSNKVSKIKNIDY